MEDATTIHESRLAPNAEVFSAPENHVFRKAYRQLSDGEKAAMDKLKDQAWALLQTIDAQPVEPGLSVKGRALSIAKTKLEESVMWAVKAITG